MIISNPHLISRYVFYFDSIQSSQFDIQLRPEPGCSQSIYNQIYSWFIKIKIKGLEADLTLQNLNKNWRDPKATKGDRTLDLTFTKRPLYRLSYGGACEIISEP
jgi:hypothetical protein